MKSEDSTKETPGSFFDMEVKNLTQRTCFADAKCSEGKKCAQLCLSQYCQAKAIICDSEKCSCKEGHDKDKLCQWGFPASIIDMTEKKRQKFPDLLKLINDRYDELVDWISKQRERIYLAAESVGLSEAQIEFLTAAYNRKFDNLTGKRMYEVVKDINLETNKFDELSEYMQESLKKQWETNIPELKKEIELLNEFVIGTCKEGISVAGFDSKVAEKHVERLTVSSMLSQADKKALRFNLLYRASENNFQVAKFWELCDQKSNTVTLAMTEFDKIIGGYSALSWKKSRAGNYEQDSSMSSFVFSASENMKYHQKQANKGNTIYHHTSYGPTFGAGHDLYISNGANNSNCYAGIGHSYEHKDVKYNTKEAWELFQGSTADYNFKVKEWEVWEVVFC